jgi:hypothetical protein
VVDVAAGPSVLTLLSKIASVSLKSHQVAKKCLSLGRTLLRSLDAAAQIGYPALGIELQQACYYRCCVPDIRLP